jgi:hypothetical protein
MHFHTQFALHNYRFMRTIRRWLVVHRNPAGFRGHRRRRRVFNICTGEKSMVGSHLASPRKKNISRTIPCATASVTDESDVLDGIADERPGRERCGYVMAAQWRYGAGDPFCNAPAVRGSSYCAEHRALCEVDPETIEGQLLAGDQAAAAHAVLPDEFPSLTAPEALPDVEPDEGLAAIDVPPAPPADDQG